MKIRVVINNFIRLSVRYKLKETILILVTNVKKIDQEFLGQSNYAEY